MKKLLNAVALVIGLSLIGYSLLDKNSTLSSSIDSPTTKPKNSEVWSVKPGSIYDGDTLRVIKGNRELRIRFCGIDAPEKKQPLGIESRDYLRSLIDKSNGTVQIMEVEIDRYGRTVAELFVPLKSNPEQEIHLNSAMVEAGMAWHYEKYSDNCIDRDGLAIAQQLAKEEKLGVWNGSNIPPWEWRKTNR